MATECTLGEGGVVAEGGGISSIHGGMRGMPEGGGVCGEGGGSKRLNGSQILCGVSGEFMPLCICPIRVSLESSVQCGLEQGASVHHPP